MCHPTTHLVPCVCKSSAYVQPVPCVLNDVTLSNCPHSFPYTYNDITYMTLILLSLHSSIPGKASLHSRTRRLHELCCCKDS